jgi:type IV pilus assembly protein PilO
MNMDLKGASIPKKYRLPLTIVLGVAILVAGFFLLIKPQFEEKDRLASEQNSAREQLAKLTAFEARIEALRKEHAQLKVSLEEALRQMPEEKEIPNLLRQVSLTAQESRTRVKYFAPKGLQPVEFYSELPFEIKYTAPYHNIGYFFDGIRKLERIVHVTSFNLESKSSTGKVILDGTCTAKAYVLSQQAPQQETKVKVKGKDKGDKR